MGKKAGNLTVKHVSIQPGSKAIVKQNTLIAYIKQKETKKKFPED